MRATNGIRSSVLTASRIDFRKNMHLVLIIHNKFFLKSIREAVRTLDLIPLVALMETSNKELQHKEVIFSEAKWVEDMHMPKWDQS
jgi:hypothetical protein